MTLVLVRYYSLTGFSCAILFQLEICSVVPSDMELEAQYMNGVMYTRPMQPRVNVSRKSKESGTIAGPSHTQLLMITDGSKGHSSDVDGGDDEDDDFVVPPPKKLRTPTVYISSEEQQAMETLAGKVSVKNLMKTLI